MRHLKRVACNRSSGYPLSQSWLAAVKLHPPLVDTDAYVASSDVSLAGYICTHICLIYVFAEETSVSLVVPRGLRRLACYLSYDLVLRQDLVDSQASQPFSFIDVCTQT